MNIIDFSIQLVNYFKNKDVSMEQMVEVSDEDIIIQIDINGKYVKQFAFFYGLKEGVINYSFIMENLNPFHKDAKDLKEEYKDVFQSLIQEDDSNNLHLYSKFELDKFDFNLLDRIYEFVNLEPKGFAN